MLQVIISTSHHGELQNSKIFLRQTITAAWTRIKNKPCLSNCLSFPLPQHSPLCKAIVPVLKPQCFWVWRPFLIGKEPKDPPEWFYPVSVKAKSTWESRWARKPEPWDQAVSGRTQTHQWLEMNLRWNHRKELRVASKSNCNCSQGSVWASA